MSAAISVRNVTKVFVEGPNQVPVLHGVDFDVEPGEVVLLMGPSGSGKTTLLSILGCILRPTSGRLELLGENVSALSEKELPRIRRNAIGFVFQGFNLFPTLSALENVVLAMDVRGIKRDLARKRSEQLL